MECGVIMSEGEDKPTARRGERRRSNGARRGPQLRAVAALVALVVVVAAIAGSVWQLLYRTESAIAAGQPVEITIAKGMTTSEIGQTLATAGVVPNALMFRLESRNSTQDGKLKAGTYAMTTGMTYEAALAELAKGPSVVYFDVPIPEGFTARQIAARVAARTGLPEPELLALVTRGAKEFAADHPSLAGAYGDSLEGYLFPATYRVKEGTTARAVVEMMLDKFDSEMAGIDLTYAKAHKLGLKDVVTIASILERESKLPKEFGLVSSVIYNRLAKPMRLQLCATVLYSMPAGTTVLKDADLKVDEPHNTYLHDGLPVGPISNPGAAALKAAANPPETKYQYYVLTGKDGSQTFTATYDEFLKAKQVYERTIKK
jgi:UPF0755 protein